VGGAGALVGVAGAGAGALGVVIPGAVPGAVATGVVSPTGSCADAAGASAATRATIVAKAGGADRRRLRLLAFLALCLWALSSIPGSMFLTCAAPAAGGFARRASLPTSCV
jgi:hypothetical protein